MAKEAADTKLGRAQEEKTAVGVQAGEARDSGVVAVQGRAAPSKQEPGPGLGPSDSRPGSQGGPFSGLVLAAYTLDFGMLLAGTQKVGDAGTSHGLTVLL